MPLSKQQRATAQAYMNLIKEARAARDWETVQAAKSGLDELLESTEETPPRATDPETVYIEELPRIPDEDDEL